MWLSHTVLSCLLLLLGSNVQAFLGSLLKTPATRSASLSSSSLTAKPIDAAVSLYQKKYPANRAPRKRAFNAAMGMPRRDVDGTVYKVAQSNNSDMGKAFSDRPEADLRATFTVLAKYFGNDDALQMVKNFPLVLAMNRNNLVPVMKEYGATFGIDDAKEMVKRNPGLLFCQPADAAEADDLTMQFSYVVAATRPLGPVLLYGTLALLLEPTFEYVSGIPLKAMLFHG